MSANFGETEAALLMATSNVAHNYKVPEINRSEHCLSCGTRTDDKYCGNCGLKNDDLRRSLFKLVAESLGGIFSFDSRMWRTWAALLFKPGKVAREYADGDRLRYSAPIRVYLVISFLLLLYLGVTQTNLFAIAVSPKTPGQVNAQQLIKEAISKIPENGDTKPVLREGLVEAAIDAVDEPHSEHENNVEFKDFDFKFLFFQPQSKFKELVDATSAEDFVLGLNHGEEPTAIGLDGETINIKKAMTVFLTNPHRFNQQFNTWLPRVMFFMVPMVMFFGVIYIRGPNALLFDHLIHAIFIHSVFFLALLVAILLSKVFPGGAVAKTLMMLMLIYLPLSLKHMFGRGWVKTIWTTLNIGFIYIFMLTIALVGISTYSLVSLAA